MQIHSRAKLGPAGRLALCELVDSGVTLRAAAAALSVSPATVHRWWRRSVAASTEERRSMVWAHDRWSRPHRSPRLLDRAAQQQICATRRDTGWGPRLGRRRDRPSALHGREGAQAPRPVEASPRVRRMRRVRVVGGRVGC